MSGTFIPAFDPLTPAEYTATSSLLASQWMGQQCDFKTITLREPEKKAVLAYIDAAKKDGPRPIIPRMSFSAYYLKGTDEHYEAIVNLSENQIVTNIRLGPHMHSNADWGEGMRAIEVIMEHEELKAALKKLKLPKGTVVIPEPWLYGSDGVDDARRMFQVFFYTRDPKNPKEKDSNHYAFPLPISVVVDLHNFAVVRVEQLPTGVDDSLPPLKPYKVPPPNEYNPNYHILRTDLKPLNVVQPEGVSFTATQGGQGGGETISWQKWKFQIGFNMREGIVLYNVSYDGRSVFYRLSLSDMNIPYADPRHPYHKKAAFDLGDGGAGAAANNLRLGCDCLGSIHYISGRISNAQGGATEMPNAICIHEQDNGIGWKHTNHWSGKAAVVRNRELVIQSIMTALNYEYILAFIFNQAGEISYEVRATGILSTHPIDENIEVPWGTVVHPGVVAPHHQHIFCLRIDPAIDGHENQLSYTDVVPLPRSDLNPHGTGYGTQDTVVERSSALNFDMTKSRSFKIENPNIRNPINKKPVAYKIQVPPFQHIIADENSYHYKRAEFTSHDIYVTKYRDHEYYAAGQYTNQSRGGTGVRSCVARNERVINEDIVVWVSFGMNHIPRIEDFPVMPVEIIRVHFKPVNFFDKNPALDVPQSEQVTNKSVQVGLETDFDNMLLVVTD